MKTNRDKKEQSFRNHRHFRIKMVAAFIILVVAALTVYFIKQIPNLEYSGSVSDLIVIEEAKKEVQDVLMESDDEQIVVMISGDDLFTLSGLKELARITSEFEKFMEVSDTGQEADIGKTGPNTGKAVDAGEGPPLFLESVLSITNTSVPKSTPINDRNFDVKTRVGCKYAFQHAENCYSRLIFEPLAQIKYFGDQPPVFPTFPDGWFKLSVNYLSHHTFWQVLPQDEFELAHFIRDATHPMFRRNLVAADLKHAAVLLTVADDPGLEQEHIISTLKQKAIDVSDKFRVTIVGNMDLMEEVRQNIIKDTRFFVIISLVFLIVSYAFCFRTVRGVVIPFITLIISEIWLLGIMAIMGYNLNIVLYIVPVFLVAIGTSASIRVLSHYYQHYERTKNTLLASLAGTREVAVTVLTASATTGFGLFMLTLSDVKGLNIFVFLCITGLAIITVLSLLFIPSINVLLPGPKVIEVDTARRRNRWRNFVDFIIKWRRVLLISFLVLCVLSALGIGTIVPDNDLTKLLEKDSTSIKAARDLSENLAGTTVLTLVLKSWPGHFIRKDSLKKLDNLQASIQKSRHVDKATSIVDLFKFTRYISKGGREEGNLLPNKQYKINSHIHFLENLKQEPAFKDSADQLERLLRTFASPDYSSVAVSIRANTTALQALKAESQFIEEQARKYMGEDVTVTLHGDILNINRAIERVLYGQTKGVIMALLLIFVLILLVFFSFKVAVLCIIPNIFPIVFFYGALGFTGIGLDLSSGLIACVAIGISVDNTIHFLIEMRRKLRHTYETKDAMVRSMNIVGSPIILTSLVLAIMFSVLCFSKFQVMSNLGYLQVATMLCCLVCNLVLLPSVISTVRILSIWDILTKFYKFNPRKAPVFAGMGYFSMKVLLGLGKIVNFSKSDFVIKQGDLGDEMFILVSGEVGVYLRHDQEDSLIKRLKVGALFGEMAVFGRMRRTATVRAETDVELLAISRKFFESVAWLYPRSCYRFMQNIITIVSKRLLHIEQTMGYPIAENIERIYLLDDTEEFVIDTTTNKQPDDGDNPTSEED